MLSWWQTQFWASKLEAEAAAEATRKASTPIDRAHDPRPGRIPFTKYNADQHATTPDGPRVDPNSEMDNLLRGSGNGEISLRIKVGSIGLILRCCLNNRLL